MLHWPILIATGLGLNEARTHGDDAGDTGDQAGDGDDGDDSDGPGIAQGDQAMSDEFSGWTFPVPQWQDYIADRSQEYRSTDHHGVDIMYPRRTGGPDAMYANATSNGAKNWFMPDQITAVCPKDGYIWATGTGPTGKYCVIDCGRPIAIFMVHFGSLIVPEGISRGAQRVQVVAGQPIGVISYSPQDTAMLKHLHIEVWRNGGADSHVDPWPYLSGAARI